jgi:hypothetical protein
VRYIVCAEDDGVSPGTAVVLGAIAGALRCSDSKHGDISRARRCCSEGELQARHRRKVHVTKSDLVSKQPVFGLMYPRFH